MPVYREPMTPITVERLISRLKEMPQDAPVAIQLEVTDTLPLRNVANVSLIYGDDSPDVDVVYIATATAHLHPFSAPKKDTETELRYCDACQDDTPHQFNRERDDLLLEVGCRDGVCLRCGDGT